MGLVQPTYPPLLNEVEPRTRRDIALLSFDGSSICVKARR